MQALLKCLGRELENSTRLGLCGVTLGLGFRVYVGLHWGYTGIALGLYRGYVGIL